MPTVRSREVGTDFRVWPYTVPALALHDEHICICWLLSHGLSLRTCAYFMCTVQPKLNPISSWANIFMYIIFTHLYSSVDGWRRQTVRWREKWTCTGGKIVWKCDVEALRRPSRTPSGCDVAAYLLSYRITLCVCVCAVCENVSVRLWRKYNLYWQLTSN